MEMSSKPCKLRFHSNKDEKQVRKITKSHKKTENADFFTGFQEKKRGIRGVRKITANKLTIQTKTLNNAVRSVFASKEQIVNIEEDSQALINQDLFKIIDLNSQKQVAEETNEDQTIENRSKSIFKEIEEKFRELNPGDGNIIEPYLISDENLQNLIANKLSSEKNLILNHWSKTLQSFLFKSSSEDAFQVIFNRIIQNQSKINETCALLELKTKFRGVALAGTCLRRKFIRRCNQLLNMQKLGGPTISPACANDLIHRANIELESSNDKVIDSVFKLKIASTPVKNAETVNVLSNTLFRTPENQKLRVTEMDSVTLFQPAILSNAKYIELDKNKCLDDKFCCDHGISKEQQKYFLNQALEKEKNHHNELLERPRKVQTVRKVYTNVLSSNLTPTTIAAGCSASCTLTPNRRLDFSEFLNENESEKIDFCLLEDVGKPNMTPLKFGGLFTENVARPNDKISPKRGLEMLLSPNELKLRKKIQRRQETVYSQAKRFAFDPEVLGPIPKARDTPPFTYQTRFMN